MTSRLRRRRREGMREEIKKETDQKKTMAENVMNRTRNGKMGE